MPKWIRSYWEDEDVTFFWEVGDGGWITRHVELVGPTLRPRAATSLDEWMRELEAGGIQQYQAKYGDLADQPIIAWDFPHVDIDRDEYERIWALARSSLDSRS